MKTLLITSDIAEELKIQQEDVFRLIAQNRIKASLIPAKPTGGRRKLPEYRIRKADFEAFAGTGLEDLTIDRDRRQNWLTRQPDLENKVRSSFSSAAFLTISDEQVLADIRRQAALRMTGILSTITDTHFEFSTAPPEFADEFSGPAFTRNVQSSYFGSSLREAFLRSRARKEALRIVNQSAPSMTVSNLAKLYETPKNHTDIIAATVARLAGQTLRGSTSRLIKYPDEASRQIDGNAETVQILSVHVRINVSIPLNAIYSDNEFLAFTANAF